MKKIAFVGKNPQVRILKQALGLKQTGRYSLTLIAERLHLLKDSIDLNQLHTVFDRVISYNTFPDSLMSIRGMGRLSQKLNLLRLKHILKRLDVDIVHAHAEPNIVTEVAIRYAQCPVIYDVHDFSSLRFGFEYVSDKGQNAERYCLENASGIIHKGADLEIDYYRNAGYKITAPVLQFQDYCVEEYIVKKPLPKLSDKDGEIHIVYTGMVVPMKASSKFKYAQFDELAEIFAAQQIHFHIYPVQYQKGSLSWYEDFARKTPYFHLHETLPIYKLTEEISQYDYGSWIQFTEGTPVIQEYLNSAIGNKFFTYLEAGLPIIVRDQIAYGAKLIDQYGIGIAVSKDDLKNFNGILEKIDKKLRHNVEKVREILSMKNQIHRLEDFYALLSKENN